MITEQEFLSCVEELVEALPHTLRLEDAIADVENLDSVAFIGLISWADSNGIFVTPEDFLQAHTLGDIFNTLNQH